MTTPHFRKHSQQSQTPGSDPKARLMAPSHVPLRNSCEECSTSKLKCMSAWAALDRHRCQRLTCSPGSSQKPSCVRCSKRGLLCEYKPQKRAGRRPGRSRSIVDENCSTSGSGSDTRPSPSNSRLSSVSSTAPTDTSLDLERFSADGPMDWETTLSSVCPELGTDYSSTLDRTHSDLSHRCQIHDEQRFCQTRFRYDPGHIREPRI
jgi:hypothetical protein